MTSSRTCLVFKKRQCCSLHHLSQPLPLVCRLKRSENAGMQRCKLPSACSLENETQQILFSWLRCASAALATNAAPVSSALLNTSCLSRSMSPGLHAGGSEMETLHCTGTPCGHAPHLGSSALVDNVTRFFFLSTARITACAPNSCTSVCGNQGGQRMHLP